MKYCCSELENLNHKEEKQDESWYRLIQHPPIGHGRNLTFLFINKTHGIMWSTGIRLNYCPFCGEKIAEQDK